jgi:beta-lactam-binding protein with PASTA domain
LRVVLSSGRPDVDVATLAPAGLSADAAEQALRAAGLNVLRTDSGSPTIPAGTVVRVEPEDSVRRGDTVTLFVSVGNLVQIPFSLQGEPLATVDAALAEIGLEVIEAIGVPASTIEGAGIDLAANGIEDGDVVGVQDNGAAFGAWLEPSSAVTLVYYDAGLDSESSGG